MPGRDELVTNPDSEALLAVLEAGHEYEAIMEAKRRTTQKPETVKTLMKLSVIDDFLAEADYKAKLEVRRKTTQDSQPHFTLELPEIEDDENKDEKDDECLLNVLHCSHEFSTPTKQDGLLQQSPFMTPPHSAKKRPGLKGKTKNL